MKKSLLAVSLSLLSASSFADEPVLAGQQYQDDDFKEPTNALITFVRGFHAKHAPVVNSNNATVDKPVGVQPTAQASSIEKNSQPVVSPPLAIPPNPAIEHPVIGTEVKQDVVNSDKPKANSVAPVGIASTGQEVKKTDLTPVTPSTVAVDQKINANAVVVNKVDAVLPVVDQTKPENTLLEQTSDGKPEAVTPQPTITTTQVQAVVSTAADITPPVSDQPPIALAPKVEEKVGPSTVVPAELTPVSDQIAQQQVLNQPTQSKDTSSISNGPKVEPTTTTDNVKAVAQQQVHTDIKTDGVPTKNEAGVNTEVNNTTPSPSIEPVTPVQPADKQETKPAEVQVAQPVVVPDAPKPVDVAKPNEAKVVAEVSKETESKANNPEPVKEIVASNPVEQPKPVIEPVKVPTPVVAAPAVAAPVIVTASTTNQTPVAETKVIDPNQVLAPDFPVPERISYSPKDYKQTTANQRIKYGSFHEDSKLYITHGNSYDSTMLVEYSPEHHSIILTQPSENLAVAYSYDPGTNSSWETWCSKDRTTKQKACIFNQGEFSGAINSTGQIVLSPIEDFQKISSTKPITMRVDQNKSFVSIKFITKGQALDLLAQMRSGQRLYTSYPDTHKIDRYNGVYLTGINDVLDYVDYYFKNN